MKRRFWLPALGLALGCLGLPGWAGETAARDAAARQDAEERYGILRAKIEDLWAAQAAQQKRLQALSSELQSVREEIHRSANSGPKFDDLKKLAEKIQELDRKREEDKKLILEEIKKLAATPVAIPEPPPKKSPPPETPPAEPQKGYKYKIKEGDRLSEVVAAYREKGVKVTVDKVLKANPGLNPNRMPIGKEVFIPDPSLP
jgi:hypothetical protein